MSLRVPGFTLIVGVMLAALPAMAEDIFTMTALVRNVAQNGQPVDKTATRGFSKAQDVINFFSRDATNFDLGYTDTSIAQGKLDFRGLPMLIEYKTSGTTLTLTIPSLNITQSFTGFSRDDSEDQLEDFLIHSGSDILGRIQRELVRLSPVDPIAGNPGSLQSTMAANDFAGGGFDTAGNQHAERGTNKLFLGLRGGTFTSRGISGNTVTLPLAYTIHNVDNPGMQINLSAPITYIDSNGSKTAHASFGVGMQFPIFEGGEGTFDSWYLTPRISTGVVGSADLAAAGWIGSGTLTSRATKAFSKLNLTVANMVGYSTTLKVNISDVESNPDVTNTIFKNGLLAEYPLDMQWFGKQTSFQVGYALTNLIGTKLYMNQYHDVSFSIGTSSAGTGALTRLLRIGFDGTFGDDYRAYSLSFGYVF